MKLILKLTIFVFFLQSNLYAENENFFARGSMDSITPYSYDFEHYIDGKLVGITSKLNDVIKLHLKPGTYQYHVVVKVILLDEEPFQSTIHIKDDGSIYTVTCTGGYKSIVKALGEYSLDWYSCKEDYI